jgi:N-acetylneuraminic acid mutarotase
MKKNYVLFFVTILLAIPAIAQDPYAWVQKAGFPGPARHRATAEGVGNRGYMGLGHVNSVVDVLFDDWFQYDPGTDTWTQKASYGGGLRYHAASFVLNNEIYVGCGRDQSSSLHTDFWKYNVTSNTWTQVQNFPGSARRGAVGFSANGYGYVGTGSYTADFYRYNASTNSWMQIPSLPGGARTSAVGFEINNKGYVGTGDVGGPSADFWEYDPAMNSWTQKANLPGLARMEAGGFSLNGKGYIGTGDDFSSGNNYQDFWCYDPATNTWTQMSDFAGSARRYLTCMTIGNRGYAGLGTSGTNYADFWEYGSISGVEEFEGYQLEIFPNPVTTCATFESSRSFPAGTEFNLWSMDGKLIRTEEVGETVSWKFERNETAAGIYLYQFVNSDGIIAGGKLILQ